MTNHPFNNLLSFLFTQYNDYLENNLQAFQSHTECKTYLNYVSLLLTYLF